MRPIPNCQLFRHHQSHFFWASGVTSCIMRHALPNQVGISTPEFKSIGVAYCLQLTVAVPRVLMASNETLDIVPSSNAAAGMIRLGQGL